MIGGTGNFAIGSVILSSTALESVAAMVSTSGFSRLELMMDLPHFDPRHDSAHQIAEILNRFNLNARTVHGPIHDVNLGALDESIRRASVERVAACMAPAVKMGAHCMVVHANQYEQQGHDTRMLSREQSVKSLSELASRAGSAGLRIAVENVHGYHGVRVGESAADLLDLIALLPQHVGICIDTGHSLLSGLDPAAQIETARHRLFLLHLSDNDGASDQHLVPGEGISNWKSIWAAIDDIGYAGPITLEAIGVPETVPAVLARCANIAHDRSQRIGLRSAEVTLFPAARKVNAATVRSSSAGTTLDSGASGVE